MAISLKYFLEKIKFSLNPKRLLIKFLPHFENIFPFQDVDVPDTMKDMQATFSGIFGEKK